MTRAAQAIHEQLVLEEDFDPTSAIIIKKSTLVCVEKCLKSLRKNGPTLRLLLPRPMDGLVKSGRKKSVELSPGQVAFAKKMRIPLEKYAQEVAKLNKRSE